MIFYLEDCFLVKKSFFFFVYFKIKLFFWELGKDSLVVSVCFLENLGLFFGICIRWFIIVS